MEGVSVELSQLAHGYLSVWDMPSENRDYVIGIDVATGKVKDLAAQKVKPGNLQARDQRDYSAAIVVERESGHHVATLHGHIDVLDFTAQCVALGKFYNQALLVPEVNSPGIAIVEMLVQVYEYQPLYRRRVVNRVDPDNPFGTEWGWWTGADTRQFLMVRIAEMLSGGVQFTQDEKLVDELRTMEIDRTGVPRAHGRDKDDRVMALGMALQGRYELMYGTLGVDSGPKDGLDHLPSGDRAIWKQVKNRIERSHDIVSTYRRVAAGGVQPRERCIPRP